MTSPLSVRGSWSLFVLVLALVAGCGDAGAQGDAGGRALDASTPDDASTTDASTTDASTTDDASMSTDDASMSIDDASTSTDGGEAPADACVPPRCPPIPPGCTVSGGTACTCGTITCPPEPCAGCTRRQYCMYETTCGGTGTCATRPDACPDVVDPVCGCDGMTYSNSCEAAAAGQSIASDGECAPRADCRTEGCAAGSTCQACRGIGGALWVCLPDGAVC